MVLFAPALHGRLFPMLLFAFTASRFFPMTLCHGGPASNKPHPAEKSTPVWLAIWGIWAGFANSQHRVAAFPNLYLHICAYRRYCHLGAAAQTLANLSAHLHRLPTPPPHLRPNEAVAWPGRRCWVLDEAVASQRRRCWVANDAAGCPWHSSCKSPRTLQKCKLLITRQLTFGAVRGGFDLCSPSTRLKVNHLCIRYLCFKSVLGDLQEGHFYASRCHMTLFPSTKTPILWVLRQI